jgi:hypothetical protein
MIPSHPLRNLGDELYCNLPPLFGRRGYRGRIADAKEVSLQGITQSLHVKICQCIIQAAGAKRCVRLLIETVKVAEFLANS